MLEENIDKSKYYPSDKIKYNFERSFVPLNKFHKKYLPLILLEKFPL
jgi:hypothetical protein